MATRAPNAPVDAADRPLVLVDIRPSACGYQALLWALPEAERRDAVLLVVAAWPGDPTAADQGRVEMEQALTLMVRRAVAETGVHGRTRLTVLAGSLSPRDLARCTGAELLVIGSEEEVSS